jgi:hypothetical protein
MVAPATPYPVYVTSVRVHLYHPVRPFSTFPRRSHTCWQGGGREITVEPLSRMHHRIPILHQKQVCFLVEFLILLRILPHGSTVWADWARQQVVPSTSQKPNLQTILCEDESASDNFTVAQCNQGPTTPCRLLLQSLLGERMLHQGKILTQNAHMCRPIAHARHHSSD